MRKREKKNEDDYDDGGERGAREEGTGLNYS